MSPSLPSREEPPNTLLNPNSASSAPEILTLTSETPTSVHVRSILEFWDLVHIGTHLT